MAFAITELPPSRRSGSLPRVYDRDISAKNRRHGWGHPRPGMLELNRTRLEVMGNGRVSDDGCDQCGEDKTAQFYGLTFLQVHLWLASDFDEHGGDVHEGNACRQAAE